MLVTAGGILIAVFILMVLGWLFGTEEGLACLGVLAIIVFVVLALVVLVAMFVVTGVLN